MGNPISGQTARRQVMQPGPTFSILGEANSKSLPMLIHSKADLNVVKIFGFYLNGQTTFERSRVNAPTSHKYLHKSAFKLIFPSP